jgi:hypothetical protein
MVGWLSAAMMSHTGLGSEMVKKATNGERRTKELRRMQISDYKHGLWNLSCVRGK